MLSDSPSNRMLCYSVVDRHAAGVSCVEGVSVKSLLTDRRSGTICTFMHAARCGMRGACYGWRVMGKQVKIAIF